MAKSRILESVHESAKRLHEAGAMDTLTMRTFDTLCIPTRRAFSAKEVRRIRARVHASQAVFAAFLGVGTTTVSQWEQGLKKPSGSAVALLDLVERKGLEVFV
jgi:putative transcriptional regulator